jgi:hypothetical protein
LYERDFACYKTVREIRNMQQRNHIQRLHAKGERQYQRLKSKLEPRYKGHILAIEVESGEYVLGKDELKVALKAVKKFPGRKFSFFRIGYPAVHKLRLQICLKVG